jgi:hypothetical protein
MYTTLKIISRKFLGVSLIWTFFSHVGAIITIMYKTNPELFFLRNFTLFPGLFWFLLYISHSHSMSQEEVLELALAGHNIIKKT